MRIERHGSVVEVSLPLPFAATGEVGLARHGQDLVVTVGSYRRVLALPAMLARSEVHRARVADGRLAVRFRTGDDA